MSLIAPFDNHDPARWHTADGWTNGNPFNNGWSADHVTFKDGILTLQLDNQSCPQKCSGKPYASGEYRTNQFYGYGLLEGRIKAAKGNGVVTSLFFHTGPGDGNPHDEIDIEILGKDPTRMQVNYFTNGVSHGAIVPLGFDASSDFHTYAIKWTKDAIVWYVDGGEVHAENGSRGPLPAHPGRIVVNLWPGIGVDGWLKPFKYQGPLQARYDWIKYTPLPTPSPVLPKKPPPPIPPPSTPIPPPITPTPSTPLTCEAIVKNEYVPLIEKHNSECTSAKRFAEEGEKHFAGQIGSLRFGGLERQDNEARVELAERYFRAHLFCQEPPLLKRALKHLEEGLAAPDVKVEPEKVPVYFSLALQKADTLLLVNYAKAFAYVERIIAQLQNEAFYRRQGESESTVAGYLNRARLIKARALQGLGKVDAAEALFDRVAADAEARSKTWVLILFLQDQNREKIEYVGNLAKLESGMINLRKGNYAKALECFKEILSWERVGSGDDPYFDLAFAALVGGLQIAAAEKDPQSWFNTHLPWEKINPYQELKEVLKIRENLSHPQTNQWEIFITRFSDPKLGIGDPLKAMLRNIKTNQRPDNSMGDVLTSEGRAKLNEEKIKAALNNGSLTVSQLERVGRATLSSPAEGLILDLSFQNLDALLGRRPDLKAIEPEFLAYFLDDREYWNNAITLISVLAQVYIGKNDREKITELLGTINAVQQKIITQEAVDRCYHKSYAPDLYFKALLNLTEAELIRQSQDEDEGKYQRGVELASAAISDFLSTERREIHPSAPDYFSVVKGTLLLGDLYQKLAVLTHDSWYQKEASTYYAEAVFLAEINSLPSLKATALIKNAAFFSAWPKAKASEEIAEQLDRVEESIQELEQDAEGNAYFLGLAHLTKGNLLLALADQTSSATLLSEAAASYLNVSGESDDLYAQALVKQIEIGLRKSWNEKDKPARIKGLLDLCQEARQLFEERPADFQQAELDYLEMTLLVIRGNPSDSQRIMTLGDNVISKSQNFFPHQEVYFKLSAKLRQAEALIIRSEKGAGSRSYLINQARNLLEEIESLPLEEAEKILHWDLHSFKAELYHQLAIVYSIIEGAKLQKGRLTYKYANWGCREAKLSHSVYDRQTRFREISSLLKKPKDRKRCGEVE